MKQFQLLRPDLSPSGAWVCGICGGVAGNEFGAERCCQCGLCGEVIEFEPGKHRQFQHPECAHEAHLQKEAKRMADAEKLESWNGWVYLEDYGPRNGYFDSIAELVMYAEFDDFELPEFVFVCEQQPFSGADMDDILCRISDEGFEDICDSLSGEKELQIAIDAFNKANESLVSYTPDYKRAVRVPKGETA